ncbi:MAG: hypothetical protein AAGH15_20445 [Myxococcota bacterium]
MDRDREKLEAELQRLEENIEQADRELSRVRFMPAAIPLAIPAYLAGGPLAAGATVAAIATLGVIGLYLAYGHRKDYEGEIALVKREIRLSQPPPAPPMDQPLAAD